MSKRLIAAASAHLILILLSTPPAHARSGFPSWVQRSVERLKTLGVLPLWAGASRPSSGAYFEEDLRIAEQRSARDGISPRDLQLLQRLKSFFDATPGGIGAAEVATTGGEFGRQTWIVSQSARSPTGEWNWGWASDSGVAWIAQERERGWVLLGREGLTWGPDPNAGLLFGATSGGFDQIQFSLPWRRGRLTRVIGWLNDNRSIIAGRLDLMPRANFRIGFSEAIVMEGGPFLLYAGHPITLFLNQLLINYLRIPSGFDDNYFASIDVEWLPRPGLRLFAELLVDDFTVPTPTANYPSRWGLTAGLNTASAENPREVRAVYTIVPNWTYSATNPEVHYMLRGMPIGHPLGADFDALHVSWRPAAGEHGLGLWATYIRKGEGAVGQIWSSEAEARQYWFLRGIVEYSIIAGVEVFFDNEQGWSGSIGPWAAFRTNADHVAGATRTDWGVTLSASWSY